MDTATVKMGELYVTDQPERISTFGVGSCVVIILCDPKRHCAGLAHAMLSEQKASEVQITTHPLRYVERAIGGLLSGLETLGVQRKDLHAHLIGGAQMFAAYHKEHESIGTVNIATAKERLHTLGIRIVTDSTGGTEGKNVHYDTATDTVRIDTRATMTKDS